MNPPVHAPVLVSARATLERIEESLPEVSKMRALMTLTLLSLTPGLMQSQDSIPKARALGPAPPTAIGQRFPPIAEVTLDALTGRAQLGTTGTTVTVALRAVDVLRRQMVFLNSGSWVAVDLTPGPNSPVTGTYEVAFTVDQVGGQGTLTVRSGKDNAVLHSCQLPPLPQSLEMHTCSGRVPASNSEASIWAALAIPGNQGRLAVITVRLYR